MKNLALIVTSILLTTSVLAQSLPKEESPCNWGSTCVRYRNALDSLFSPPGRVLNTVGITDISYPGVYYQRAIGKNCADAQENAREKLVFNHPEFECNRAMNPTGIACEAQNIGPKLVKGSCMKSSKGEVVAWIKCDTTRSPPPRQKADPGVGIILIGIAQRGEVKARASKIKD